MPKSFLLIDETMTMHGIRFSIKGGRWERFNKNPVMLYMHTRGKVVGKWVNVRLEAGAYKADPVFDLKNQFSAEIARQVNDEFLNACSIGVQIHSAELINNEVVATDWEPYECSIVDAGSNYNALQLYTEKGEAIADTALYIKNLTLSIQGKQMTNQQFIKEIPTSIALSLGLTETSSNSEIVLAITGQVVKNNRLEQELRERTSAYFTLLGGASTSKVEDAESDKAEWDKRWKEGTLHSLKAENPERYKQIFKASFGAEPEVDKKSKNTPANTPDSKRNDREEYQGIKVDKEEYFELWKSGGLQELKESNFSKFLRLHKAYYGVDYEEEDTGD